MTAIDDKHAALRAGGLDLGGASGPEGAAAGGGRFRHYAAGSIYWSSATGAHEVHGNIRAFWSRLGSELSWLGYPTTDEVSRFGDRYRTSTFEYGILYWDPDYPREPFALPRDHAGLLVVSHPSFRVELARLVEHKRATGMPTLLIDPPRLAAYPGRDDAERVKRAVYEAHHDLGVRHVLLMGDASRVPVRYRRTRLTSGWTDSWYTAADLYYANLYLRHDAQGRPDRRSGYNSWDADGDGDYNQQNWADDLLSVNPDQVDGFPDVAVGRVPAHGASQVRVFVDKVLRYETGQASTGVPRTTLLIDAGYGGADTMSTAMVRNSGASYGFDVEYVGMDNPAGTAPPSPFRVATPPEVANAAQDSTFMVYVGHGATEAWAVSEGGMTVNVDRVRTYVNANLPIVVGIGCSTGEWVYAAPDHGPQPRYLGEDQRIHHFWQSPDAARPTRVWDTGASNDPNARPIGEWTGAAGTVRVRVPRPAAYDLARRSPCLATAWLFNPVGGGVAYFGETTVAQNNWGRDLATGLFGGWAGSGTPLGDMWRRGQQHYWRRRMEFTDRAREDRIGAARSYLTYMTLFGDPSLRILDDARVDRFQVLGTQPAAANHAPVSLRNGDGRVEVYVLDREGRVRGVRQTWSTPPWTGWEDVGRAGQGLVSLAAGLNGDGRPELFGLERNSGSVWHAWRDSAAAQGWSPWTEFDGDRRLAARPVVVLDGAGLLHLFARSRENQVCHRHQTRNPFGLGWSGWQQLASHPSSPFLGDFTCARNTGGRLELVTRGADGGYYALRQQSSASDAPWAASWTRLSNGRLGGDPTLIRRTDGRLQVFGVGLDDRVWTLRQSAPGVWATNWEPCRSPTATQRVSAVARPGNAVALAALTASQTLITTTDVETGAWVTLGRNMKFPPDLIANTDGRLEVFSVGPTFELRHRWQTGTGWN